MIEFKNRQKIVLPVIISLVASIITIIMVIVTFFLGLLSSGSKPLMPGILGGLCVLPIFGLSFAFYLLRIPVRIVITDSGLTLEWLIRQKTFSWGMISRLELKEPGVFHNWVSSMKGKSETASEILVIFDPNGKKLFEIGDNIENFSVLMEQIRQRSSDASGKTTFNAREQIQKKIHRQNKNRILLLVLGIIFAGISITLLVVSIVASHNKQLLKTEGRIIEAAVTRHYIYNVTPRLEYSFTTEGGETFSKNVMVNKAYWETLEENGTVPVRYLPSNPKINTLAFDDANDSDIPLVIAVPLCLVVCFFGGTCIVMYFLKITDLKFENGRFKVLRVGDVESKFVSEALEHGGETADPSEKLNLPEAIPVKPVMVYETETEEIQISSLPKGLKAIGVLNIVFGGLGFLWNVMKILLAVIFINNPDLLVFNIALPEKMLLIFLQHLFAAVLALLLIVSGVGILLWKNWARILAVVVVIGQLVVGLKDVMVVLFSVKSGTEGLAPDQVFILKVITGFYTFLVILTMVYPAVVLLLLQRRSTREVFRRFKRDTNE
ncbi:MAG: DUF3592 domain-containing protein [Phycisphaerae bacterium]|nr:DUF3592 domain-containing protein [Phycisphaerae bacterium]NIS54781.1 DUF3592 domain-containing protein [Phycisphaerae bacterium]NIV01212.1 DUF3592 domain-containing protein [Phycisphaerae bacterium]NIV71111.1 DUF3592 domain-containing protein [Phycisphaerae bacterium]NIX02666.1 DUF3592 domain-containing protein [Phycisphaerae bacterium]